MNLKTIALPLRPAVLACLCIAMLGGAAHAQLMVDMRLEKKTHIDHEPVMATIQVKNLAGHDLILSGPGGGAWLNFDIRRGNNGLSKRPDAPTMKPRALKAGAVYTTTVNLGRHYPLALPGDYGVTAAVYYPPLKKYFSSRRNLVKVRKAKTIWSQSFGVPRGQNRPIEFRKYTMLTFRDRDTSELYVRVSAQDDSAVYSTFSLGNVLRSYQPKVDIDSANRLHILHLGAPERYVHSIIDTGGTPEPHKFYKPAAGDRPILVNQRGNILVRGGIKTDRHGQVGLPRTASSLPGVAAPSNRPRSTSERPPGLPQR